MTTSPARSIALIALAAAVACSGCASTGPRATTQPAEQWQALFNGQDLHGWKSASPESAWVVASNVTLNADDPAKFAITTEGNGGILVNGSTGKTSNIYTTDTFGDIEAHIEFMVPKGSNSGIYFMGSYEIQVFDSYGKDKVEFSDCGGIYARWIDEKNVEGHAPRVNASRKPGEWQTFDVVFRAPRFDASGKMTQKPTFERVLHNGQLIHENVELNGFTRAAMIEKPAPTGPIMLQGDHGPVAYRNIIVRPLK